jgi:DNA repair protein RAD5
LLVLSKSLEEDQQGDGLLDLDTSDKQGSLKEMIATYAGGVESDAEGHVASESNYALQVLKEIGESEGTSECMICTSEIFDEVLLPCYHRGSGRASLLMTHTNTRRCQDCIVDYIGSCEDQNKPANCPMCDQGPYKMSDLRSVQRRRKRINPITCAFTDDEGKPSFQGETAVTIGKVDLVSSTKLRALVRKLEQMRVDEPDMKVLVFSQFTSFLGTSSSANSASTPLDVPV